MKNYLIIIILLLLFLILLSIIQFKAVIAVLVIIILISAAAILVKYLLKSEDKIKTGSKIVIYAIPAFIILYLLYMNLGLGLFDRNIKIEGEKYIELNKSLVYSNITVPSNAEKIIISVRFRDNFPENSAGLFMGAKTKGGWRYQTKPLYLKCFEKFKYVPKIEEDGKKLYFLNNKTFSSIGEFTENIPRNSAVATNLEIGRKTIKLENYSQGELKINTSLRGSYTFYVYAKNTIELSVSKQDLNWHEGEDSLEVSVYDNQNKRAASRIMPDDGITNMSKTTAKIQTAKITIPDIIEGVYRIDMENDADLLIREIKINQNKLVVDRTIFLADNNMYGIETIPSKLYTRAYGNSIISLLVYHPEGYQNITINNKTININEILAEFNVLVNKSEDFIEIDSENNDIIIGSANYYAFSKESYFDPLEYHLLDIEDADYADYVLTDYEPPSEDDGWLIGTAEFNTNDLSIKDNKLSIVLNARHLGNEAYSNYTIPVDYLETKGII
jgi:hypothetical protein